MGWAQATAVLSMGRRGPSPTRTFAIVVCAATAASCLSPSRRDRQLAFEARQATIEKNPEQIRAWRKRDKPRLTTPTIRSFAKLAKSVGARPVSIDAPCINAACSRRALGRVFRKLDRIDEDQQGVVRILVLGDSHIAADYITRTIRDRLQRRFGDSGRGFVAIDQKSQYGGRRINKSHWRRTRIVDGDGPGQAFGFAGMRLDASKSGARMEFKIKPEDDDVVAYFLSQPKGPIVSMYANGEKLGDLNTKGRRARSRTQRLSLPERQRKRKNGTLRIIAQGRKATFFGLSFESYESGIIVDSIGPVGADASTYLQMDARSLYQHLRALDPDLVMLMIGGNDALAIRRGVRTLAQVEAQHRKLVRRLRKALPRADCLIWAPLDAGVKRDGRIESRLDLLEIRDLQRRVANDQACGFWDAHEAMGGVGSFRRWLKRGLMNQDLVHPRSKGGDLLGHLFATAFMNAYLNGS